MARLFITPREIDYISDLTKEVTKDIIGQKIFYYKVREDLTNVHDVYEEAPEKIFNPPIEIDALVDWQPEVIRTNQFGSEEIATIEIYLHSRDLLDKEIKVLQGDYFSYGAMFFEITSVIADKNVYGQVEHKTGVKLVGKQARKGQINIKPIGPTGEEYSDDDAVQTEFVQQRGVSENRLGETGDIRSLQENEKLEAPISGPHEVSNNDPGVATTDSSFYGDDC
ncbi:MAG: hypothetical protein CME70_06170 [Halobacteriovorax sp.]|nr:hypothetical protein [Halobacteriovorax sp.]|tara:strand:+ start:1472 stop:2143 length:672 start_codon:yes stop_codon:yes gene_type:complete